MGPRGGGTEQREGGRSGAGMVSPAGAAAARRARGGRRRPRVHCLRRELRVYLRAFFCTVRRLRSLRHSQGPGLAGRQLRRPRRRGGRAAV